MATGNKNESLISSLTVPSSEPDTKSVMVEKAVSKPSNINSRKDAFGDQANTVLTKLISVDPARCRMWEGHNRNYDLLNKERCADLIEGYIAQGKQEIPAIVRRIDDGSGYDFEVICGARRHWTATYIRQEKWDDFLYLIEPRELTDEQAFRLSDIENRDRDDISDYERALDYKNALKAYYGGEQKKMAQKLECDPAWLSRLLKLADLPIQIVKAYQFETDILVNHYKKIAKFLTDPAAKKRMITKAERITGKNLVPASVISELAKSGADVKKKESKSVAKQLIKSKKGIVAIQWLSKKNDFSLTLSKKCSKEEMSQAFEQFMEEAWE